MRIEKVRVVRRQHVAIGDKPPAKIGKMTMLHQL
jgi:hypothetical protein